MALYAERLPARWPTMTRRLPADAVWTSNATSSTLVPNTDSATTSDPSPVNPIAGSVNGGVDGLELDGGVSR